MTLYYNGVDITDAVELTEAEHHDASSGRCDCTDLTFTNPVNWYAWSPEMDDVIRVEHNGYDTGDMYVSAFFPEAGVFRLTALSIPTKARTARWQSFKNMRLTDIAFACAKECGMGYGIYGVDGNVRYPFVLRKNEGAAAFLNRLCAYEGAVLKCVSGRMSIIGVQYAQSRDAVRGWELDSDSKGVTYSVRSDIAAHRMIVRSPAGDAKVDDTSVNNTVVRISDAPASCASDAGRWARGLLLCNNRKSEVLTVDTAFDPNISAMQRVDVQSNTRMNGEWVVDEVTHDFLRDTTCSVLYRSVMND